MVLPNPMAQAAFDAKKFPACGGAPQTAAEAGFAKGFKAGKDKAYLLGYKQGFDFALYGET